MFKDVDGDESLLFLVRGTEECLNYRQSHKTTLKMPKTSTKASVDMSVWVLKS